MAPPRRFGPEVSRIIFVRNLPYKATGADVYAIFGKFGAIRQVRLGKNERKGNAFVVYHTLQDAKRAMDALSGFNADGRFLTLAFFHASHTARRRLAGDDAQLPHAQAQAQAQGGGA